MKRKKSGATILAMWALCAVVIAAVFATGVLNKQKVWTDVQLDYTGGSQQEWRIENGDEYGYVGSGPYYNLPVGTYRVKWQIDGDGANRMVLSSANDARITPAEITIEPGKWEDEAWFEIKDPTHSFFIHLEFASGSFMRVDNIRLYSPFYTDSAFTFAAALIVLCLLATLYLRGRLSSQGMRELAVLAIAVMLASIPCLRKDSMMVTDTHFHAARIMNLADGLRSGSFPVRVGGFSYNGYGAVTSVFYPDLLLYPWALMLLGGASMAYVLNSLTIVINALTVWCMWKAGERLLGNRQAALCASLLYLFSIYRVADAYNRFALGEMLAMTFLPFFFLGLYEVVLGEKRRWPTLVLGMTLVFRSHMPSTVLCAGTSVMVGLLFLGKIVREKRIASICAAMMATLLINLNQIVPMLMSFSAGVNTTVCQFGFANAAMGLSALLEPSWCIGMALIIGVAAFVAADVPEEEKAARRVLWLILGAGVMYAVLATNMVPWGHISELTGGLVDMLQFPWRFLSLAATCFALVGGDGIARMQKGKGMRAVVCALALGLICWMPYIHDTVYARDMLEFGQSTKTYMIYPEYQIEGTDVNATRSRKPLLSGDVTLTAYEKDGTRVTAQVQAQSDAQVTLPMFGFIGYAVELNGERMDWTLGENNRLTVSLPAGAQGELRIWYEGKTSWKVMDVLSVASAMGLAAFVLIRRKQKWV
ncbi:MAG: hypothetical protein ACI4MP_06285 [Candidatus Ventricola sp.]